MKIGQLANRSGLSVHTIRYYESIGLLPPTDRGDGDGDNDEGILDWISFIDRLKAAGMPLREIAHYAALREQGDATLAERRQLLERHRERVRTQIALLESSASDLDDKIDWCRAAEAQTRTADSHG